MLNSNLKEFNTSCVKTIKEDSNRQLVMTIFDAIRNLLSRCAPYIKNNLNEFNSSLSTYGNIVIDTFENKVHLLLIDGYLL